MKDLVISSKRVKTELMIALACFICAVLTNIVCIIVYQTPWHEVFSDRIYRLSFNHFLCIGAYWTITLFGNKKDFQLKEIDGFFQV